jgi:trehalose-6-phosphate hydrolase
LNAASFGQALTSITVGEMSSTTIENCILYSRPDRQELSMTFNFHHLKVDYADGEKWSKSPADFAELKRLFHTWGEKMSAGGGWNALFWNNHDQPRAINRFIDYKNFRVKGATMLAASIHLSRGTPYIYMGEEIGMIDPDYASMADYVDVESINAYQMLRESGKTEAEAFEIIRLKSRDNSRTPMQWDRTANAGFSTGKPWLAVGNHADITVEDEKNGEIYCFYQKLIALRKADKLISEGTYQAVYQNIAKLYAFIRVFKERQLLVVTNFSNQVLKFDILPEFAKSDILINNYSHYTENELQPYQAIAFELK